MYIAVFISILLIVLPVNWFDQYEVFYLVIHREKKALKARGIIQGKSLVVISNKKFDSILIAKFYEIWIFFNEL